MNAWRESVEEHRETLESWANSDLPLTNEMQALLEEAESQA
jgi:hypothetical protein